jgi:hypothetical protein
MKKLMVEFINQSGGKPEIRGAISYTKDGGLQWDSFKGKLNEISKESIRYRGETIDPEVDPEKWIKTLFIKYNNQYLMATKAKEVETEDV